MGRCEHRIPSSLCLKMKLLDSRWPRVVWVSGPHAQAHTRMKSFP